MGYGTHTTLRPIRKGVPMQRARLKTNLGRARRLKVPLQAVQNLVIRNGPKCANPGCDNPATDLDHNHKLKGVKALRGALCGGCNTAFGSLGEDPRRIRGLAKYWAKWQHVNT